MRVLFIADKLEPSSGSAQKVGAMAQEWERRGHTVWLATARDPVPRRSADIDERLRARAGVRSLSTRVRGELAFRALYPSALVRACGRLGVDLIYSRLLAPAPGLGALIASGPFVLEINGDIAHEMPISFRRWSRLRARSLQLGRADGVVFVSRELRRHCDCEPRRSIVLANPCLPTRLGAIEADRPARPTLVLIGYDRHAWSGMDKLVTLAQALPEFDFVAIGAHLQGPANLRSLGLLAQDEADRVIAACTVGVGPLATHRKGMHEASPLKSRNYLALGLPIIQSYEDTDLTEADGCVLQLPNREDNVLPNIERIREFTWRAFSDPTLRQRAKALAQGRLSLAEKESERLAFMEACVRQAASRGL